MADEIRRPRYRHVARAFGAGRVKLCVVIATAALCPLTAGCYVEPDASSLRPPTAAHDAPPPLPFDESPPEWVVQYREGVRLLEAGDYEAAIGPLNRTIELTPNLSLGYLNRAVAFRNLARYKEAIADIRQTLERNPPVEYMPLMYLAEILAVCPDAELRDGDEAVRLATQGCEKTGWQHGPMLAVLAAAYAEIGNFDEAVHWQTEACSRVKEELASEMAARLRMYHDGEPCRRLLSDPRGMSR